MLKNKLFLIAFFGTILAVFWQELNLFFLHGNFPYSHGLITCADEVSYLKPARNFFETGIWSTKSKGIIGYFMRPPGFGLYYLTLLSVFGKNVWFAMKIAQVLFSFFSVILFYKSLKLLKVNNKAIYILSIVFAFLPCYSGFMYFTITESISPFFMLLTTYFWIKSYQKKDQSLYGFILSGSFLILIRPQLIVFIILFSIFLLLKLKWKNGLLLPLVFLPFLLWNIRTFTIAKKWMAIHPIYHETNNSLYRPNHEKMTNLFRIWDYRGDVFHTTMANLSADTNEVNLKKALNNVPLKYQSKVKGIFKEYQQLEFYRQSQFKDKAIKTYFKGEIAFGKRLDETVKRLKKENKLDFYLKTPFQSLKKLIVSSQMNLKIFQEDFRGYFWCEILRWICLLVLISSYFFSFIYFLKFKWNAFTMLSIGISASFFYLAYVQRMNEERYLTPILPLALLMVGAYFINTKSDDKDSESEKSL